ncbi:DUF2683 family protein [Flavobacterium tegetincola]|uniref:DUF2683 family protein n=1 Tax=Flavobacterium tegetincola TaxID=150172 RepID=UPI0004098FB5|nr:DUF2683 family protein [Flavobacterium tegetincola]
MDTIIIHAEPKKKKALIEILKAFDIPYEVKKKAEKTYDPEFVKMVLERRASAKNGNTTLINPEDLWGSLGLK